MSHPDQAKDYHGSLSVGEMRASSLGRMKESEDKFGGITGGVSTSYSRWRPGTEKEVMGVLKSAQEVRMAWRV